MVGRERAATESGEILFGAGDGGENPHGRPTEPSVLAAGHGAGAAGRALFVSLSMALLGALKLALISNREIIAAYRPHDDYWQILAAASWVWWRPYDQWALMHLPVYPSFVGVNRLLGLPLRISIELLYLAGAALLSCSLGRLGDEPPLQVVAFGVIAFHPFSYSSFDYALAETLYACLMLIFVAFFVRLLAPTSATDLRWSAAAFACTTALMWHCRKESVLIGLVLGLTALALVAGFAYRALSRREALRLGAVLVGAPVGAAILLGLAISTANGMRYGLWHTSALSASNFTRAYSALLAIRPDPPIRFVPVTREVRQKAYAVSPAFRELGPILDGHPDPWYKEETQKWLSLPGEIGAGWFYWALLDAGARAGHFRTATDGESFLGRVADEVGAAVNDGRLPSRRVVLPFLEPDLSLWLPHLPGSVVKVATALVPVQPPIRRGSEAGVAPQVVAVFDAVANRRTTASGHTRYFADGWILSSGPRPLDIRILGPGGGWMRTTFQRHLRPDVPVLRGQNGTSGPEALGFAVDWPVEDKGLDQVKMEVVLEGGIIATSPAISSIPVGRPVRVSSSAGNVAVFLALDRMEGPPASRKDVLAGHLVRWYPLVLAALAIASIVRLLFIAVFRRSRVATPGAMVLLLLLAVIGSRLLFFSVLDASAWAGNQTRYLFPVATLTVIVPVLLLGLGWESDPRSKERARP